MGFGGLDRNMRGKVVDTRAARGRIHSFGTLPKTGRTRPEQVCVLAAAEPNLRGRQGRGEDCIHFLGAGLMRDGAW